MPDLDTDAVLVHVKTAKNPIRLTNRSHVQVCASYKLVVEQPPVQSPQVSLLLRLQALIWVLPPWLPRGHLLQHSPRLLSHHHPAPDLRIYADQ